MIATVAIVLLLGIGPQLPPPVPTAVASIPDEPGAVMLPEAGTYQAVAVDVDGDGVREVVRLVAAERGAIELEVWRGDGATWSRLGASVNVVPVRPTSGQGNVVYAGSPVRLIVRSIGDLERTTLIRQPRFQEPGLEAECCVLVDDVILAEGSPTLVPVAERGPSADAVLAIDLDGDGTDELLVTRGRPPLGDTTFPTTARVHRWAGERFAAPTITELGVGSGVSPFILGDSDGVPGEEAAFIGAQSRLHRVSLRDGDVLQSEDGGASVTGALAVPLDGGGGIAIMSPVTGLAVHAWPRDQPLGPGSSSALVTPGILVEVVSLRGGPHLLVRDASAEVLHVLSLPSLAPASGPAVTRSPAAGRSASGPVRPFLGRLPGGGPDGEPAAIYAGRILPVADQPGAPLPSLGVAPISSLAGAQPIGLVGRGRGWLAILHAPLPLPALDPSGGRLEPPVLQPGSGVSLSPLATVLDPERDDGAFEPEITGGAGPARELVVGPDGFTARITAPPGSRVFLAQIDPTVVGDVRIVPAGGELVVPVVPPPFETPNPRYRATVAVTTPSGRGYLAAWDVRVLTEPPSLEATTTTPIGSGSVVVTGTTDPAARLLVAGAEVAVDAEGRFRTEVPAAPWPAAIELVATDLVGNEARSSVVGIGWFDYRGLPWLAITVALVAVAAVVLFLRVPRAVEAPRAPGDDAALEELDPADEP